MKILKLVPGTTIEPINESGWDEFFRYANEQRSENGTPPTGYFLPVSRAESCRPYDKEELFRSGLRIPVGSPNWRRAWVARGSTRQILGHVDLRSHAVRFAEHRCLLGMGVDRHHRGVGLGSGLISHACAWAVTNSGLEWIDLEVLSANEPALRLYLRNGFAKVADVPDMFRIDGMTFSVTTMTRRLEATS